MTVTAALFWAGLGLGAAGLLLWQGLGLVALWRDPARPGLFSLSPARRLEAMNRQVRLAGELGRATGLGRIANLALAAALTFLMAAGLLRVATLILSNQGQGS